MNSFDDIQYPYDGHVFVWVRPVEGKTWDDILQPNNKSYDTAWRPCMMKGDLLQEEHRGTSLDGRSILVPGSDRHFSLDSFEFGSVIEYEEVPTPAFAR